MSTPTPSSPPSESRGIDARFGPFEPWFLSGSIMLATIFGLVVTASSRANDLAAITAAVATILGLIPWLWMMWLERRARWIVTFRLVATAVGLMAIAQTCSAVYELGETSEERLPRWIDGIWTASAFLVVIAASRFASRPARRRERTSPLLIPAVTAALGTAVMIILVLALAGHSPSDAPVDWVIGGLLIGAPLFAVAACGRDAGPVTPPLTIPREKLAMGWAFIAVAFAGIAADRLLDDRVAGFRTIWALVPAFAFLSAGTRNMLAVRARAVTATEPGVDGSPVRLWISALAPSVLIIGVTTFAVVKLTESRAFGNAVVAALALLFALAILIHQTMTQLQTARAARILERTRVELAMQATVDPVSGLPNRRALDARLAEEVERAVRYRQPLSLCFIDVDFFKQVNDHYGHSTGDAVLREVGNLLRRTVRAIDFVGRNGGEEFVILLPGTWSADAENLGDRLRRAVQSHAFNSDGARPLRLTISVGIAGLPEHAQTGDALRDCADTAVYAAKRSGRNQVILFEPKS